MQSAELDGRCSECSEQLLDLGDELVCPRCGVAVAKDEEAVAGVPPQVACSFESRDLGSYMGTLGAFKKRDFARGITGTNTNFRYLKTVSDFAGRGERSEASCAKVIERVGQKLFLPGFVIEQAESISSKVLARRDTHRRMTVSALSAYSLIAACKVSGVASVSVREIIDAHTALGKQVTSSSVIQLALASPLKTRARSPVDYISLVLARLSRNERVSGRVAQTGDPEAYSLSLRATANELLSLIGEESRVGRRPSALAASAVYSAETVLACCESRRRVLTQRELAECVDSAEYTIREQCASVFMPAVKELIVRRTHAPVLQVER